MAEVGLSERLSSYIRVGVREVMWRWHESGCRGNSHHPQIKCGQADLKPVRQRWGMPPSDLAGELAGLDMPQDPEFINNSSRLV